MTIRFSPMKPTSVPPPSPAVPPEEDRGQGQGGQRTEDRAISPEY
jgi:hypothetical protein